MKKCLFGFLLLHVASVAAAGTVSSFDDIEYWVGNGQNKAALVIDWVQDSSTEESLVWGFRWAGTASGEDMLQAIVTADARLYDRVGTKNAFGLPLYGLGYDLNQNGIFGISDGTTFNGSGIAVTGFHDGAVATDLGDLYKEGWYTGFWAYVVSTNGNPYGTGHWSSSNSGMSGTTLTDGDWNGFTYETDWGFDSYPENPHSATAPEPSTIILAASALLTLLLWRWRRN